MLYGDLSNKPEPKILIVFEGLVGLLPAENEKSFKKALSRGNWPKAASYWTLNEMALRKILDLQWRRNLNIEIVSFSAEDLAAEFELLLENAGVGVKVWHSSPEYLARKSEYMPDVIAMYDADSSRQFTYGRKGRIITGISQLGEMN